MDGWAADVTGDTAVREAGSVWLAEGKRMGDIKGLDVVR